MPGLPAVGNTVEGRNPEGKGLSDSTGKPNEGRPFWKDEREFVSFKSVPLGLRGFPDIILVGTSPLVPRCTEELFFPPETGTEFVSVGLDVSRLNEELLLPSGTGTEVGRLLELGSPVPGRAEELLLLTET